LTIKSTSHTTRPYLPAELRRLFGLVNATFFTLAPAVKTASAH